MRPLLLVILLAIVPGMPVAAQVLPSGDPGRAVRTRDDLERLLEEYEAALVSSAYSERVKSAIRADARRVMDRLENGDFRVGDRITVTIQGEPNSPYTAVVEPGPMIQLDPFGEIPLHGVLRSEIEEHLFVQLQEYLRNPVVRATGAMRVAVLGSVGSPGFYSIPAETLLEDAIMLAGGPSPGADIDGMRLERAGESLFEDEQVQEALRGGYTLDQLNLQAGDQIFVPGQATGGGWFTRALAVAGTVASVGFILIRVGIF
jgi:protein involved in polysaccharide export with SLBB domain